MSDRSKTPSEWITWSIVGFFAFIINITLFKKELAKRKAGEASFATEYLRIWSISCISLGAMVGFDLFVFVYNGFCHFTYFIFVTGTYYQIIFMGFYQLSRLYYCFAQNKVYSTRGYPNSVFIVMYTIGAIIMVIVLPLNLKVINNCGIDSQWIYNEEITEPLIYRMMKFKHDDIRRTASLVTVAALVIWDMTTLILYAAKISMLYETRTKHRVHSASDPSVATNRTSNDAVQNRIISILCKIAIVTLFYEFMTILSVIIAFIDIGEWFDEFMSILTRSLPTVSLTFSMYIMMDHHQMTYRKFIHGLYVSKLYWIGCCCCCGYMVKQQVYQMYDKDINKLNDVHLVDLTTSSGTPPINRRVITDTIYDGRQYEDRDSIPYHTDIEFQSPQSDMNILDISNETV